jgi:hypothetical protein
MYKDLNDILDRMNLQTFADGGEGGGEAADAGDTGKGTEANPGDLSTVKYGKQEAEAEPAPKEDVPKAEETPEEPAKKQSFDELVKSDPEYQKEMQKRIDNAINRRFAKSKAAEEQQSKLAPALNLLATKYGVQAGDTDALINAINGDSDLIEQQAMDAGMEPEAYREFQRLKAENESFKRAAAERERQESMNQTYQEWRRQEAEAQQIFPGLSLDAEIANPQFSQLLGAGIDVLTAYKTIHLDEIGKGLVRSAAADAQKETIAKIQNKQGRPREGASGKAQAAVVKTDISKLTIQDYDEIMRRAGRGETIRF